MLPAGQKVESEAVRLPLPSQVCKNTFALLIIFISSRPRLNCRTRFAPCDMFPTRKAVRV